MLAFLSGTGSWASLSGTRSRRGYCESQLASVGGRPLASLQPGERCWEPAAGDTFELRGPPYSQWYQAGVETRSVAGVTT